MEQALFRLELSNGGCSTDPLGDAETLLKILDDLDTHTMNCGIQEGRAAEHKHVTMCNGGSDRACLDYVKEFLHGKNNDSGAKHAVGAVATNAIWCKQRFHDAGYDIEDVLCDKCVWKLIRYTTGSGGVKARNVWSRAVLPFDGMEELGGLVSRPRPRLKKPLTRSCPRL